MIAACAALTVALLAPAGTAAAVDGAAKVREVRAFQTAPGGVRTPDGLAFVTSAEAFYATSRPGAVGAAIGRYDFLGEPAARADAGVAAAGAHAVYDPRGDQLVLVGDAEAITTVTVEDWLSGSAVARTRTLDLGPAKVVGIALDPATDRSFVLDRLSRRIAAVPGAAWRTGRPTA
jgi:hypothetical protein